MEEDCNAYIADYIVICCCCQCLVVQVAVPILIKFPLDTARRTRQYVRKKLQSRREEKLIEREEQEMRDEYFVPFRVEIEGFFDGEGRRHCMEEVEQVMQELVLKGEFAFGSFWGG